MPMPQIASTTYIHSPNTDLITTRCPFPARTSSSVSLLIVGIRQSLEPCAMSAHYVLWLALTVATQVQPFLALTIVTSAFQSAITHATLPSSTTRTSTRAAAVGPTMALASAMTISVSAMGAKSLAITAPDISMIRLNTLSGVG